MGEGLNSLTKKMDERLMLILSMISQKLIYMTTSFNETDTNLLKVMLENLSRLNEDTQVDVPLSTLYFIRDKPVCSVEERDVNFLNKYASDLVNKIKATRMFYIADKNAKCIQNETKEENQMNLFYMEDSSEEEDNDEEEEEEQSDEKEEEDEKDDNDEKKEEEKIIREDHKKDDEYQKLN